MRSIVTLIAAAACLAATAGCNKPQWPRENRLIMNTWAVEQYNDDAIRNGVVAQHTLYPHHFYANAAELNALGRRDLRILAEHYRDNPGRLNVRRGDAADGLYSQRVDYVTRALSDRGVDMARIDVADRDAGGEGLASGEVVVILRHMHRPLTPRDATTTVAIPAAALNP